MPLGEQPFASYRLGLLGMHVDGEVKRQTIDWLDTHSELREATHRHLEALHYAPDLAPISMDNWNSGLTMPFMEAGWSCQSAVWVAMHGLYGMARRELRVAIDLWVLGMSFIVREVEHDDLRRWLRGSYYFPRDNDLRNALMQHKNYQVADDILGWQERQRTLREQLHAYVHPAGFKAMHHGPMKGNVLRFEDHNLHDFLELFHQAAAHMVLLMAIFRSNVTIDLPLTMKFGGSVPIGGFLEDAERECVLSVLDEEELQALDLVYQQDDRCQGEVEWIRGKRDLTPDELQWSIHDQLFLMGGVDVPSLIKEHVQRVRADGLLDLGVEGYSSLSVQQLKSLHALLHTRASQLVSQALQGREPATPEVAALVKETMGALELPEECRFLVSCHDAVASEVERRDLTHNSPIDFPPWPPFPKRPAADDD